MATYLTFLFIRFGLIVAGLVVLALLLFTAALVLKRRGRLGHARRRAAPVIRAVAQYLHDHNDRRSQSRGVRGRGALTSGALDAAARYLDDDRQSPRWPVDCRPRWLATPNTRCYTSCSSTT